MDGVRLGFSGDREVWPLSEEVYQAAGIQETQIKELDTALARRMSSIQALTGYLSD